MIQQWLIYRVFVVLILSIWRNVNLLSFWWQRGWMKWITAWASIRSLGWTLRACNWGTRQTKSKTVKRGTASSLNTRVHSCVWLIQERYATYALCDVNHPAFVTKQCFLATCLWPCEVTGSVRGREKVRYDWLPLVFPPFCVAMGDTFLLLMQH